MDNCLKIICDFGNTSSPMKEFKSLFKKKIYGEIPDLLKEFWTFENKMKNKTL